MVLALPSGPSVEEYAYRLARVRELMTFQSLSALVVTDPANLYYLIGYNAWSFYTPQCLIIPASGPIRLFTRAMDADGAGSNCIVPAAQIEGYPEYYVHRADAHPFEWIARRAVETGVLTGGSDSLIAVEGDTHFFSARGYLALASGVPDGKFVDSTELINWVRSVKSLYEQQLLRAAGAVTTQVMTTALLALRVGRRQCDVVADILAAQARGTPDYGGDYPAIVPMLPTGASAGTPHLTWTDQPIVEDEATTIELAGVFRRYHVPLARTVMVGAPHPRLTRLADTITEAMGATLEELRPGATPREAHRAFSAIINRAGYTKDSRIGYSIGIGYPPDWGERTISLRHDDTTELLPGMAFHVILGMWMHGWGYELSEPVLLTDSGAEPLTNLPRELTITTA